MGVLLSSVVFGVAHFPFIYGRGALLKALLGKYCRNSYLTARDSFPKFVGLYFAMVYMWSGYNLVVPVLVHAVYDFTTVFGAWYSAIKDLNKNLESTIKRLKIMPLLADEDEDLGLKDSCRKVKSEYKSMLLNFINALFEDI